jgi:UDP-glucose 4-epimerase
MVDNGNFWRDKQVLVTGGAGAIGGNLLEALRVGGAQVVVVDDLSSGYTENLPGPEWDFKFIHGDLADEQVLQRAFAGGVDYIFHLAAFFANQNSVEHPEDDLHTNGLATLKLAKAAARHGVERLVFSSSSCVYGAGAFGVDETADLDPETPYAITKVLGEQYLSFYQQCFDLPVSIVRYFNSYGPGERPGRYRNVVPNFFASAIRGEPLAVMGDGLATRDFTYVGDIVDGTMLAASEAKGCGEIFNLGTGGETSVIVLAEEINRITGNAAGVVFKPQREWDGVMRRCADIVRAKRLIGYDPTTSLQDGLAGTYRWFTGSESRIVAEEAMAVTAI